MTFRHFDALSQSNEFWTMPIDRLNQSLEKNQMKDVLQKPGISLVYGCPLSQEILDSIETLKQECGRMITSNQSDLRIAWREHLQALHFSVYGLVMPDDYQVGQSWPLTDQQISSITDAFHAFKGMKLTLQGIGILGMGAISIRVSDSSQLEKLRDSIGAIAGLSRERFGSRTKKIVIGRIAPSMTTQSRECMRALCDSLRDMEIGTLSIDSLEIIHYKNTLLDAEYDRVHLDS